MALPASVFSPSRFLVDIEKTCAAINAPFSERTIQAVVKAYSESFSDGAVLWRATDRPGDPLNFRFLGRRPIDTIAVAVNAGFIPAENPLARLIASWGSLYKGTPQSCDFDAQKGLAKTWIYLGARRPLDEVLGAAEVPESIRRHGPLFHELGLTLVRHVAVDYHSATVNIYFHVPGQISEERAMQLVGLAAYSAPSDGAVRDVLSRLNPDGFTFAVTMRAETGEITRVAFYALRLPVGEIPPVGERLEKFLETAPSYDDEEMNGLAWSFGAGGKRYIKAERSYCGQMVPLLRDWNTPLVPA